MFGYIATGRVNIRVHRDITGEIKEYTSSIEKDVSNVQRTMEELKKKQDEHNKFLFTKYVVLGNLLSCVTRYSMNSNKKLSTQNTMVNFVSMITFISGVIGIWITSRKAAPELRKLELETEKLEIEVRRMR